MAILVDAGTRVCIQGITGRIGQAQTRYMQQAGTRIVAGVTPGKEGQQVEGVPVFASVAAAQAHSPIDATVVFVPPAAAEAAVGAALEAGVRLVVLITEGVPVHATMRLRARARAVGACLLGPTTPGSIAPERTRLGILPAQFCARGPVGVLSRSGTLSYEIGGLLSAAGMGQSTVVGLGADPVVGADLIDLLKLFAVDSETRAIVLIGEIGGRQEEEAARHIAAGFPKPVVAYVAGRNVPPGVRMGHAGAIIQGGTGTAQEKLQALAAAGVQTATRPTQVVELVRRSL